MTEGYQCGARVPLPDLDVFVAVVDHGSLTAAANHLGMPRATLSRRLTKLEEELDALLLHRSTRRLALTEAGEELYRRATIIVADVKAAELAIRELDTEPRGLLRVSSPPAGQDFLGELISTFMKRYPEVQVELLATTRFVDLVAEGYDVAIRAGTRPDETMITRRVLSGRTVLVATPSYLQAQGRPSTPADLSGHSAIVGFSKGEHPQRAWPLRAGGTLPISPRLATNELPVQIQAVRDGIGIAMLPLPYVRAELIAGTLEALLVHELGGPIAMDIVFAERKYMLPKVRAFVDHAAGFLQRTAEDWSDLPCLASARQP